MKRHGGILFLALCWSLPAIALSLPARSLAAGPPSGLNVSNTEIESTISESGNIVITWGGIAADAIARPNEAAATLNTPGVGLMLMAQVQLAVYDVMVALKEGKFEPFSYDQKAHGNPDRDAAVATAAYRVLRTRIPGRAAYLDAQYATSMSGISDGKHKTRGIELGEAVAAHYLALRANDHIFDSPIWVQPTPGPGVFEPVAPTPPVDYKLVFVPPYTFDIAQTPSYFPPPPPALTSDQYTHDWTQVRDLGRVDGTIRTAEQKQLALWTGENSFRWESRNVIALAVAKGLDPMQSARLFAMVFTSGADTLQAGMSAKYHYNFWRPFHAIPRADTDGNPATVGDPTWKPTLNINHPEYPAGHGFLGGASMIESVRSFFETDAVEWTLGTVGVVELTQTSRTYTSLTALGEDIMFARILAGLHYRFSMDAGQGLGRAVNAHVMENNFRPTHGDD